MGNPDTGKKNITRYKQEERDQLANCMLLTAAENGAGGKSDTSPDEWFTGERKTDDYLDRHLIPKDPTLWKPEKFDEFIAARKKLILAKFKSLLASTAKQLPSTFRKHTPPTWWPRRRQACGTVP